MQLKSFVDKNHVKESLRLFTVSTLAAAKTGDLAGAEGFTSEADHEQMKKIESEIKRRFPVGTQVVERNIIQQLGQQGFQERAVRKVIMGIIRSGNFAYRVNRKLLYRIK